MIKFLPCTVYIIICHVIILLYFNFKVLGFYVKSYIRGRIIRHTFTIWFTHIISIMRISLYAVFLLVQKKLHSLNTNFGLYVVFKKSKRPQNNILRHFSVVAKAGIPNISIDP